MEDGDENQVLSASSRNNGQRGIHRRSAASANRGEPPEHPHEQWRSQQGKDLTEDITHQGNRSQLGRHLRTKCRLLQLSNQNSGKGIIGKTAPDSQTIRHTPTAQEKAD